MYIDLIVLAVLLLLIVMFFKRFSSFVFFMAIIDISLRIFAFIKHNLGVKDVTALIDKYLPESIFDIIDKYTSNMPNLVLKWAFVIIMTFFLGYIIKIFFKKKKI